NHLAHRRAFGVGRYGQVDDVGTRAVGARMRVKRVLKDADHQNTLVTADDVFRAVAVVHVKIDNGDAL
ncbi:MAG: hypothetical protein RIS97_98, partial [Pseudomonadota bacterium]